MLDLEENEKLRKVQLKKVQELVQHFPVANNVNIVHKNKI